MEKTVIVVGGGAAGMMAAVKAAEGGAKVTILEKNEKLGKKLYITGKGRCNITNACDTWDFFPHVLRNSKFLMSAVYSFDSAMLVDFFEKNGLATKVERGQRIFPASDRSSDVIACLRRVLEKKGVSVVLNTRVKKIAKQNEIYTVTTEKGTYFSDKVIIATGGVSYPATGSTGDGYDFGKNFGHTVTDILPALVPLVEDGDICRKIQGISLKNVKLSFIQKGKVRFSEQGELLFTHFGLSGPLVLSASGTVDFDSLDDAYCAIDLKPALDMQKLDKRIVRDFDKYKNKQLKNALGDLLLSKMILPVLDMAGVDAEKEVNTVTRAERENICGTVKNFLVKIKGTRGFDEAVITRGGIAVREINPATMESKIMPGLFFAGEVIDCDAETGGYNLQIAFSTGSLAGMSAAE